MKFTAFFLAGLLASAAFSQAQEIILKNGKTIEAKHLRRIGDDDVVLATVELQNGEGPGQPAKTGQIGYAISDIERVNFPEPPEFKTVPGLTAQGKFNEALAKIDPVVAYYRPFMDVPGNQWAKASLLRISPLIGLERDREAETLANLIVEKAPNAEIKYAARVRLGILNARRDDHSKALEIYDEVLEGAALPATLARAAVGKGQSHLAREEWTPALMAFLQVPVFYPQEENLMPAALLGCGTAYAELEDFSHGKAALNELIDKFPSWPEATKAKNELKRITKLEKADKR